MRFGPVALAEAAGAVLAHSLRAGTTALRKGRVLTADDVAALAAAGIETVIVARLDAGDLDENAAAERLAMAAAGEHLTASAAATGRVNLFAAARGLAVIDAGRIDRINAIDEALTIATLPALAAVEPGRTVATVKLITYGLAAKTVGAAAALAAEGGPVLRLAPFAPRRIGLLQTVLAGHKESLLDKGRASTEARLRALDCRLEVETRCAHAEDAIATALKNMEKSGCEIILVLGASAVADRRDVVPAAVEAAGGTIEHLGMPVDPGNLTLLANLGRARLLGLPGSARSPRLHGFDPLLQRLVAGFPVTGADLAGMGVGGLLKDVPDRPLPRRRAAPPPAGTAETPPRIAALVLAAGRSRRMGPVNKMLAEIDGQPMVARAADAALASRADPVIAVTGHQAPRVTAALAGREVEIVHNPDYASGLSTSLRAGLAALPADADGVLVCLGDMPRVAAADLDRLIAAFESAREDPEQGHAICVPVYEGKRGNPVLWARRYFAEMQGLAGDVGARHLIGEHQDSVIEVDMAGDGVLLDVDSPDALAAL